MKLTSTQLAYLKVIDDREKLTQGWGGYKSTLTVRILEERGLIRLNTWTDKWIATITSKGRDILIQRELSQ